MHTDQPLKQKETRPSRQDGSWMARGMVGAGLNFFFMGGVGYLLLRQWKKAVAATVAVLVLSCVGLGAIVPFVTAAEAIYLGYRADKGDSLTEWQFFTANAAPQGPQLPPLELWQGLLAIAVPVVPMALLLLFLLASTT